MGSLGGGPFPWGTVGTEYTEYGEVWRCTMTNKKTGARILLCIVPRFFYDPGVKWGGKVVKFHSTGRKSFFFVFFNL